jgi:hypothetical protein
MDYLESEIMPRQRERFGPSFADELTKFEHDITVSKPPVLPAYIDYVARKFYFDTAIGCIRVARGLPYRGSF